MGLSRLAQLCLLRYVKIIFLLSQLLTIFSQVFTVHIILYGHTFPMAYCLCLGNRVKHTIAHFIHLKDAALVVGYTLDPFVTVSDFEIAMIQAASINFSNASDQGYYYSVPHEESRKIFFLNLASYLRNK